MQKVLLGVQAHLTTETEQGRMIQILTCKNQAPVRHASKKQRKLGKHEVS